MRAKYEKTPRLPKKGTTYSPKKIPTSIRTPSLHSPHHPIYTRNPPHLRRRLSSCMYTVGSPQDDSSIRLEEHPLKLGSEMSEVNSTKCSSQDGLGAAFILGETWGLGLKGVGRGAGGSYCWGFLSSPLSYRHQFFSPSHLLTRTLILQASEESAEASPALDIRVIILWLNKSAS